MGKTSPHHPVTLSSRQFLESSEELPGALSIAQISKNDYTDFSLISVCSNLCNRLLIGGIRDFWTFSEISSSLDKEGKPIYSN